MDASFLLMGPALFCLSSLKPGEKVENDFAGDLLLFMFMEESGKEGEIAFVCIESRGLMVEGRKA